MALEVVQHLARRHVHKADVSVEGRCEVRLVVLRWDDGCHRICARLVSGTVVEEDLEYAQPRKSVRSSPIRRSYVRTWPSTDPVKMYDLPTCMACTASRASSNVCMGARVCDLFVPNDVRHLVGVAEDRYYSLQVPQPHGRIVRAFRYLSILGLPSMLETKTNSPLASTLASSLNSTAKIFPICPGILRIVCPVITSHRKTCLSPPEDAKRLLSCALSAYTHTSIRTEARRLDWEGMWRTLLKRAPRTRAPSRT